MWRDGGGCAAVDGWKRVVGDGGPGEVGCGRLRLFGGVRSILAHCFVRQHAERSLKTT